MTMKQWSLFILLVSVMICLPRSSSLSLQQKGSCVSRRDAFWIAGFAGGTVFSRDPYCHASDNLFQEVSPEDLVSIIPRMPFGAPATNATIPSSLAMKIEMTATALEKRFDMKNLAQSNDLSGSWRLLYSNGAEIANLAAGGLPLGLALGPTYQPLDTKTALFENSGIVRNSFAQLETIVSGDLRVAEPGTLNAVGVINDRGNRVDVDFQCIIFQLDQIFGIKLNPPFRKTIIPKLDSGAAQPANDIAYLDKSLRIVYGGDGALFILQREEGTQPMLTREERDEVIRKVSLGKSKGSEAILGVGSRGKEDSAPPELKFLFQEKDNNK